VGWFANAPAPGFANPSRGSGLLGCSDIRRLLAVDLVVGRPGLVERLGGGTTRPGVEDFMRGAAGTVGPE
jgi:hypothetical protein